MRRSLLVIALAGLSGLTLPLQHAVAGPDQLATATAPSERCDAGNAGLPVSRIVEIDTSAGPLYGGITKQVKEDNFLADKEVVLTFDDGPMPWVTGSILETLEKFCTKATFFAVGKMAMAYPATVRRIADKGHTLGSHTWSHPLNLKRLKLDKAMDEIERGFAAVSLASGGRAAPFFRFPGLSDNAPMLDALQKRGIASFSVDVVSNDSYTNSPDKVIATTLKTLESTRRGILLFHDIKPATAKALPELLTALKARGYKVVHMRATAAYQPLPELAEALKPVLAKKDPPQGQLAAKAAMLPFYGTIGPTKVALRGAESADDGEAAGNSAAGVQTLAPPPRERIAAAKENADKAGKGSADGRAAPDSSETARRKVTAALLRSSVPPPDRKRTAGRGKERDGSDIAIEQAATGNSRQPAAWSARVRRERMNRTFYD